MSRPIEPALTAPHKLSYTYKRSLGPILGKFFTALRDRQILGVRRKDGSVLMPPKEYDPETAEALTELVPVAETGIVKSWAWVQAPRRQQPLQKPFAYALIQLDGAATPLLHVVDAGSPSAMKTGMRVRARWREQTAGAITDIAAFVPEA
jgi:hypothetical protein